MTELSPTTARIVEAFDDCYEMPHDDNWQELCVAEVLRALANNSEYLIDPQQGDVAAVRVDDILARVAELEAS